MNDVITRHFHTDTFEHVKNAGVEFKIDEIQREAFTYVVEKQGVVKWGEAQKGKRSNHCPKGQTAFPT